MVSGNKTSVHFHAKGPKSTKYLVERLNVVFVTMKNGEMFLGSKPKISKKKKKKEMFTG